MSENNMWTIREKNWVEWAEKLANMPGANISDLELQKIIEEKMMEYFTERDGLTEQVTDLIAENDKLKTKNVITMANKIAGDKIQQHNTDIIYETQIFDDETFCIIGPKEPISVDSLEDVSEIIHSLLLRAINFRNYTFRGEIKCYNCGIISNTCTLIPINNSGMILCERCKKEREDRLNNSKKVI